MATVFCAGLSCVAALIGGHFAGSGAVALTEVSDVSWQASCRSPAADRTARCFQCHG